MAMTESKLGALLEKRGISRADLVTLARTSSTLLRAVERWNYRPRPEAMERICKALDCRPTDLWKEP